MQTLVAAGRFGGELSGHLAEGDAVTAFHALIHRRRQAATVLREIDQQCEAFIEARRQFGDKRLATQLWTLLAREKEKDAEPAA